MAAVMDPERSNRSQRPVAFGEQRADERRRNGQHRSDQPASAVTVERQQPHRLQMACQEFARRLHGDHLTFATRPSGARGN